MTPLGGPWEHPGPERLRFGKFSRPIGRRQWGDREPGDKSEQRFPYWLLLEAPSPTPARRSLRVPCVTVAGQLRSASAAWSPSFSSLRFRGDSAPSSSPLLRAVLRLAAFEYRESGWPVCTAQGPRDPCGPRHSAAQRCRWQMPRLSPSAPETQPRSRASSTPRPPSAF